MNPGFDHYLSFGDSISIDDYAGPGLGAGSLLHTNQPGFWPDFAGLDLATFNSSCRLHKLALNGTTLAGLWKQLERSPALTGRVLVTITVGGNDVLRGLGQPREGQFEESQLKSWTDELIVWIARLRERYPGCQTVLGNIYDPSDGSGRLSSGSTQIAPLLPVLRELNRRLEEVALSQELLFADIYSHFLGNALGETPWVYREIEPTQRGSSEVRRVFWRAITA